MTRKRLIRRKRKQPTTQPTNQPTKKNSIKPRRFWKQYLKELNIIHRLVTGVYNIPNPEKRGILGMTINCI